MTTVQKYFNSPGRVVAIKARVHSYLKLITKAKLPHDAYRVVINATIKTEQFVLEHLALVA